MKEIKFIATDISILNTATIYQNSGWDSLEWARALPMLTRDY